MVMLTLDGLRVSGRIQRVGSSEFAIRFDEDSDTRAKLIRFVYSGRFSAEVDKIDPLRVATATLERVMR
jgi:hypothetical protein